MLLMSQAPQARSRAFVGLLLIAVAIGAVSLAFSLMVRRERAPRGGLGPGNRMPRIQAEGWLNGPGPTEASLKGKVLVVDAWAHWCVPCLAEAPHLVSVYEAFHDRGVVFIGLTGDSTKNLDDMKEFLRKAKVEWPCAYGAIGTLQALKTESIPQVWVVGADGRIRWNMDSGGKLDDAIEEALSSSPRQVANVALDHNLRFPKKPGETSASIAVVSGRSLH